jgi:hypothetical protein
MRWLLESAFEFRRGKGFLEKACPVNVDMVMKAIAAIKQLTTFEKAQSQSQINATRLIPNPIDQNPCAHWRNPMDMIRQG